MVARPHLNRWRHLLAVSQTTIHIPQAGHRIEMITVVRWQIVDRRKDPQCLS